MAQPPSGTVTFLFTDIEGSTRRWEAEPAAMKQALARHDAILRERIERHGGHVFKTVGDAFHAVFATPGEALGAAVVGQRTLAERMHYRGDRDLSFVRAARAPGAHSQPALPWSSSRTSRISVAIVMSSAPSIRAAA